MNQAQKITKAITQLVENIQTTHYKAYGNPTFLIENTIRQLRFLTAFKIRTEIFHITDQ